MSLMHPGPCRLCTKARETREGPTRVRTVRSHLSTCPNDSSGRMIGSRKIVYPLGRVSLSASRLQESSVVAFETSSCPLLQLGLRLPTRLRLQQTAGMTRASAKRAQEESRERSQVNKKQKVTSSPSEESDQAPDTSALSERKWASWSAHEHRSPFQTFHRPTPEECTTAHAVLERMHGDAVREEFASGDTASEYPYVLDALIVAAVSQATSWSNGKRALKSMETTYGSTFAYEKIVSGGIDKLEAALRPGGMQTRKSKMVMAILADVHQRYGTYDLNHLFDSSDDEAMKELLSYKGIGPKCAHCVMSMCLQRSTFAVDVHIHRIAGRWKWRPEHATKEEAQAHLDARIPPEHKLALHFLLIQHGRQCKSCRGNAPSEQQCEALEEIVKKGKIAAK